MRMLMHAKFPLEPFNTMVRKGTVGATIQKILEAGKPEAVYFTEYDGRRGAILIIEVADASKVPGYSEPWFLAFNASIEIHPVMVPEDLTRAGSAIEAAVKKYG